MRERGRWVGRPPSATCFAEAGAWRSSRRSSSDAESTRGAPSGAVLGLEPALGATRLRMTRTVLLRANSGFFHGSRRRPILRIAPHRRFDVCRGRRISTDLRVPPAASRKPRASVARPSIPGSQTSSTIRYPKAARGERARGSPRRLGHRVDAVAFVAQHPRSATVRHAPAHRQR